ncbi:MAG: hypothetical protein ABSD68_03350 [Candidatus Micrarchaeales archaeon]|jgi:hypothetical protein
MRAIMPLFFLSLACAISLSGAQSTISGFSREYANATINQAIGVVNLVNESGYLIFSPNLTQAYLDLNRSISLYNTSPASAVIFANKAANEANAQYVLISGYKQISFIIMLAFTTVFTLIIIKVMKPVKSVAKRRKKG